jgi:hypothetical protein
LIATTESVPDEFAVADNQFDAGIGFGVVIDKDTVQGCITHRNLLQLDLLEPLFVGGNLHIDARHAAKEIQALQLQFAAAGGGEGIGIGDAAGIDGRAFAVDDKTLGAGIGREGPAKVTSVDADTTDCPNLVVAVRQDYLCR